MVKKSSLVSISNGAFGFCRYGVMILAWLVIIFRLKWLMIIIFAILFLSYLFKVKRAPMILVYTYTINKIFPSKEKILDENAMRFAHGLGSIISFFAVLFLYLNEPTGYVFAWIFAIVKTISAIGFCPASKAYSCMTSGTCCAFARKFNKK
jgi:hypothetical protein